MTRRQPSEHVRKTLRNDQHGTATSVIVRWYVPLVDRQIRKIRQRLCPAASGPCTCGGGMLKEAGPQEVVVVVTRDGLGKTMVTIEPGPRILTGK